MYKTPQTNPAMGNPDVNVIGVQYEKNVGVETGDQFKNTAAICNSSASHTYGNVLSVVEKYILDNFPKELFKTVTASTTLASRQVNHLPHQLIKKEMPIMVLVPRIVFGQEDRFLSNTLINSRMNNLASDWGNGSLLELGRDKKRNVYVNGHYNRALMYVDVVMSFNTYMEQMNWMNYMHSMFPIGHNQFVKAPLELYIPENFCELISNVAKVPVKDQRGSISDFLSFMNGMFYYPITYKLKGGSNTDEFFMYYIADIDTTIGTPEAGQGIKDGQIRRNFDISFTVRCEFNTISYFTLTAPSIKKPVRIEAPTDDMAIVPIFSDVINLQDFDLPVGWSILGWPIFKLKIGESSISLDPILNESLNTVIDYHLKFGIPMERFINIQFRENGEILSNEMFYIDWHTRELHLVHPDMHRTYRLIITVCHDYINNLIKELYNLE